MVQRKNPDLIYGVHPVIEKLNAKPEEVAEVLVIANLRGRTFEKIHQMASRNGCLLRRVETTTLDEMTGYARHQGIAARVTPFKYASFPALLAQLTSADPCCVAFLDGITDPRNFGSILRTSEAMGIGDVVIPKDRAVGVTPTVIKASAGAAQHVRVYRVANLTRSLVAVRERGLWIIGLDPRAERPVHAHKLPDKLAVVLGAEGAGMRPLIRATCDDLVRLPMQGRVASMNVSVAWGMFAYELTRQRVPVQGS